MLVIGDYNSIICVKKIKFSRLKSGIANKSSQMLLKLGPTLTIKGPSILIQ